MWGYFATHSSNHRDKLYSNANLWLQWMSERGHLQVNDVGYHDIFVHSNAMSCHFVGPLLWIEPYKLIDIFYYNHIINYWLISGSELLKPANKTFSDRHILCLSEVIE